MQNLNYYVFHILVLSVSKRHDDSESKEVSEWRLAHQLLLFNTGEEL